MYLPDDYERGLPVAVVAGQREYPRLVVEKARAEAVPVRLVALEGETSEQLWESFPADERRMVKVGQIGKLLKSLQTLDARYAMFVGQVTPGRLFKNMSPDIKALSLLSSLKERNAHTIFGAICAEIEKINVRMLDARSFMDNHLALSGLMTGGRPKATRESVEFGVRMAREIARLDIGQGVVVRKGTVLAVEAFEGTDEMLSRANKYKTDKLVFVKTAKHDQNPYFDWPVFGMKTLETMARSGIGTAALEAERVIILKREKVLAAAREKGIEILGV